MAENDFFTRLKANPHPVVVDFWAPWCGPCKMVEPALKKLGQQYQGQIDVWKVNADEQPDLLRQLKIYGIPTLVGFHNGREVLRQTGVTAPDLLERVFQAALSGEKPPQIGFSYRARIWMITLGGIFLIFGYTAGFREAYLWLAIAGGLIMLAAVYDRFAIFRALQKRILTWLDKSRKINT